MDPSPLSIGVGINFSRGGQRRHFAYTFQVADDAIQTDVYKALYPFYAKRKLLLFTTIVTKNALCWQQ